MSYGSGGLSTSTGAKNVPFGIGWKSHFNYSFARLHDNGDQPFKRKDFAILDFTKKEVSKTYSDCEMPVSCMLTQYHVVFAYSSNLTVVSLIN